MAAAVLKVMGQMAVRICLVLVAAKAYTASKSVTAKAPEPAAASLGNGKASGDGRDHQDRTDRPQGGLMVLKSTPWLFFADIVAGSGSALGTSGSNVVEVS